MEAVESPIDDLNDEKKFARNGETLLYIWRAVDRRIWKKLLQNWHDGLVEQSVLHIAAWRGKFETFKNLIKQSKAMASTHMQLSGIRETRFAYTIFKMAIN